MELDHGICYTALKSRDARFDGRFFTGVSSTGVYCRPVCPARTPRAEHCTFYACAAAAEDAGYRPCRRCRPETAPGTPAWQGTSATVARALRLIDQDALDEGGIEDLAARLGVGGRHLRRLFLRHLGAAPLAVARTRRAHHAKRMIEQTDLSMTAIAIASGYGSVRRFNAAVKRVFRRTPSEIRRQGPAAPLPVGGGIVLTLSYRPPLDWDAFLAWLEPRLTPRVESVRDGVYRRSVAHGSFAGLVELSPVPGRAALALRAPGEAAPAMRDLAGRARTFCDLDADPAAIADHLRDDPDLAAIVGPGGAPRVPGCWDRFELAVRAILGQQVSVRGASRLAGRLAEAFGRPLEDDGGRTWRLFPGPADLASADIASVGMPASRAETIRVLASAVMEGEPVLETAPDLDTAVARLTALPGIGDWTAQYIALRGLGEPDAFPAGDLGLRKALAAGGGLPTEAAVRRRAAPWRPWRGYAAMALWNPALEPKGRTDDR